MTDMSFVSTGRTLANARRTESGWPRTVENRASFVKTVENKSVRLGNVSKMFKTFANSVSDDQNIVKKK